jgi:hypothetical protein
MRRGGSMTRKTLSILAATVCAVAAILAGCSREETKMPSGNTTDYRQVALEFVKALAAREYAQAYAMTSQGYRQKNTVEQLRAGFEAIVPTDWGDMGPVEVVSQTMTSWPGKQPADLGWAYVSIGGAVYSEAVTVVVTSENGAAKVRETEFGRP